MEQTKKSSLRTAGVIASIVLILAAVACIAATPVLTGMASGRPNIKRLALNGACLGACLVAVSLAILLHCRRRTGRGIAHCCILGLVALPVSVYAGSQISAIMHGAYGRLGINAKVSQLEISHIKLGASMAAVVHELGGRPMVDLNENLKAYYASKGGYYFFFLQGSRVVDVKEGLSPQAAVPVKLKYSLLPTQNARAPRATAHG